MFLYWFVSISLLSAHIDAKLLHRELVTAPKHPIQVCIQSDQPDHEALSEIVPIIRVNLNLSGLIAVETKPCPNLVKLSVNHSLMGTRSIEIAFLGSELSRLPSHKVLMPKLTDPSMVNQYANKITRTIHEYITHHRGWHDRKIAFISKVQVKGKNQYTFLMSNIDGSEPKKLFQSEKPLIQPLFSPDGQKVALTEIGKHDMTIHIKEGDGAWKKAFNQSDLSIASSWSPDSQNLLIVHYDMQNPSLFSLHTLSNTVNTLMPGWSLDCDATWAKDNLIYLASSRSGTPHIYRYELNKKLLERITFQGESNLSPSTSKDRMTMTYVQRVKDEYRLMTHFFQSPEAPKSILSALFLQDPKISDDGSWILLTEHQGRRDVIGLIDTHGQTHIRLIAEEGQLNHPTWVPESWSI